MSDDVTLCPVCGRPAPTDGAPCRTVGCPAGPSAGPRATAAHDKLDAPRPNRPAGHA